MNTAIQSVHNLAWKLAAVIQGWGGPALLDTYELERRPVASRTVDLSYQLVGQHPRRAGKLLGLILGAAYDEGALVPDGSPAPIAADPIAEYLPTARPGHRAPHHWVSRERPRTSTLDLFDGRFVLLSPSHAWCAQGRALARDLRVPLTAHVITDPEWTRLYDVGAAGAVLVRPDGYVAWRTVETACDEVLRQTLTDVLSLDASGDTDAHTRTQLLEV